MSGGVCLFFLWTKGMGKFWHTTARHEFCSHVTSFPPSSVSDLNAEVAWPSLNLSFFICKMERKNYLTDYTITQEAAWHNPGIEWLAFSHAWAFDTLSEEALFLIIRLCDFPLHCPTSLLESVWLRCWLHSQPWSWACDPGGSITSPSCLWNWAAEVTWPLLEAGCISALSLGLFSSMLLLYIAGWAWRPRALHQPHLEESQDGGSWTEKGERKKASPWFKLFLHLIGFFLASVSNYPLGLASLRFSITSAVENLIRLWLSLLLHHLSEQPVFNQYINIFLRWYPWDLFFSDDIIHSQLCNL